VVDKNPACSSPRNSQGTIEPDATKQQSSFVAIMSSPKINNRAKIKTKIAVRDGRFFGKAFAASVSAKVSTKEGDWFQSLHRKVDSTF
jgi:hypothetical protein